MEQRIKNRFSEEILKETLNRYEVRNDSLKVLDGFESFIYEFENQTGEYILRIGHSNRRSEGLIQGEVEWINFLADKGITVASAVPSKNMKFVEAVPDHFGESFLATAFNKAKGNPPWGRWTPELFEKYGELIGKIHAVTNQFQPTYPDMKRPEWDDPIFDYVHPNLPDQEWTIKQKYKLACDHVNHIPKNPQTYGLIHQDAHGGNLFIDDAGQITLFDFDDCCYSWFINDIAIVLFYIVMSAKDQKKFTREFLTHFLKGYLQNCPLDYNLLKEIPYFLKIREIELFTVIQRDFGSENIEDEWCNRYMKGRKEKIENDVPFIDFDFELSDFF